MRITYVALLAVVLLISQWGRASADPTTCATDATLTTPECRIVVDSIYTLESNALGYAASKYDRISITCYYPATISPTCSGGGDFDRSALTGANCRNNADGAYIIKDAETGANTQCFQRQNFGVNGVADARQCGVVGDGMVQDWQALETCLGLAKAHNVPVVNTGGGQIRDDALNSDGVTYGQDILVPGGVTLTCGGTAVGLVKNNDYRAVQHAIILAGGHKIRPKMNSGPGMDDGSSAKFDGCLILRADNGGTDIYAPSIFVPSTLREALQEVAHYAGTAIDAESNDFVVSNTTILGFAQCWLGGGPGLSVIHTKCDGTAGFWVVHSGGGDSLDDVQIRPFLTGTGGCTNCSSYTWENVSGVSNAFVKLQQNMLNNEYQAVIDIGTSSTDTSKTPEAGDTIWIGAPTTHVQSAAGRYVLTAVSAPFQGSGCPGSDYCVSFDLPGSVFSSVSNKRSATAAFPAGSNVLTGLSIDIRRLAVGMEVDSNSGCVQRAQIVAIHPAWNSVWISTPTTCDSGTHNGVRFWDDDDTSPSSGSATLTATERTGDAYRVTNAGGVTFSNCRQNGHYVGFHVGDQANLVRFLNCANDSDPTNLQDDDLIGLLCDGEHNGQDCADVSWINGVLSQHAAGAVVLNSDSTHVLHIANAGMGPADGRQTGRYAEVEAGVLALDNSSAGVAGNLFVSNGLRLVTLDDPGSGYAPGDVLTENGSSSCSVHAQITIDTVVTVSGTSGIPDTWHQSRQGVCTAWAAPGWATSCARSGSSCPDSGGTAATGTSETTTARLAISNVVAPNGSLYLQDSVAAGSTSGCGNVFAAPTPYRCAPSSFTQLPGGRLTLTQGQPVMTQDVLSATSVYYVPYLSQQVPIYSLGTGVFGLVDIGPTGLTLALNSNHGLNNIFDVFVETLQNGIPELCSGPAWSSLSARSSDVVQINGVWVNAVEMHCDYSSSNFRDCPPLSCTYLGSFYTIAHAGQTVQQFGPVSGSGGGAPCLCLYNAYNHVTLTSASADTNAAYSYALSTWRFLDNNPKNSVTVLDGLAQMQIAGLLNDALSNGISAGGAARTADIGVEVLVSGGSATAPPLFVQASSGAQGSCSATLSHPPIRGLWAAYGVESSVNGSSGTPMFGGSPYQQLGVQVAD